MRNVLGTTPLAAPEWTPSVEDVDRQRAAGQASQRRRDPQPVVVVAARVEAHDERRRPDLVGQGLQVGGEVGGAALLARFDEHQAAGVGAAGPLHGLDGGQRGERRVAVVGATAPVQAVALDHRRPRPEAVAPAVHLRLLVQVAVEEHGVVAGTVAEGGDVHDDERRAAGQLGDVDRQAGDRAGRGTSRPPGRRRRPMCPFASHSASKAGDSAGMAM